MNTLVANRAWEDYKRLRSEGGAFKLDDHTIVEFSGSDWRSWLQGQITQDIRLLSEENSISFCMTKPTGQMVTFGDLHLVKGKGWMVVPKSSVQAVLERVDLMVITEDVQAEVLDVRLVHVIDASDGLPSNRTGMMGFDQVVKGRSPSALSKEAFEIARLEAGLPSYGIDTDERTLPPELGERFDHRYVSYSKGCYTGQEILQRIHSRGHTNQTWRVYTSRTEPKIGTIIGKNFGRVTSRVAHPKHGWLVGAIVRNEFAFSEKLEFDGGELIPHQP